MIISMGNKIQCLISYLEVCDILNWKQDASKTRLSGKPIFFCLVRAWFFNSNEAIILALIKNFKGLALQELRKLYRYL